MKSINKVIIPTDFTVASLNYLVNYLQENSKRKNQVLLVHGYEPTTSISEMLFFSKSKILRKLETQEFKEALNIIKNRFESSVESITIDFITSSNKNYITNFIDANQANEIVEIENYKMYKKDKNSFNVNGLLNHNNIKKITIKNNNYVAEHKTEFISDVFVSKA